LQLPSSRSQGLIRPACSWYTQRSDAPNNGVHGRRHAAPAQDFSLSHHAPERRLDNNLIVNPRRPATRTVRGLSASASCGRVDPVFRPERCAAQGREHRMDPKSANPLLGPMLFARRMPARRQRGGKRVCAIPHGPRLGSWAGLAGQGLARWGQGSRLGSRPPLERPRSRPGLLHRPPRIPGPLRRHHRAALPRL
jgi:hypothetical protein